MIITTKGTMRNVAHLCNGPFVMLVAGDRHQVRPVRRRHDHSGDLGAGDVKGSGALVLRALDAGAAVLVGRLVVAENALLQQTTKTRGFGGGNGAFSVLSSHSWTLKPFWCHGCKIATSGIAELKRPSL